jgi:hypothetical protein
MQTNKRKRMTRTLINARKKLKQAPVPLKFVYLSLGDDIYNPDKFRASFKRAPRQTYIRLLLNHQQNCYKPDDTLKEISRLIFLTSKNAISSFLILSFI